MKHIYGCHNNRKFNMTIYMVAAFRGLTFLQYLLPSTVIIAGGLTLYTRMTTVVVMNIGTVNYE